jgi:uncharacterized DUF497 family protein
MRVVWDPIKARANLKKHGVRFPEAEHVLFDPLAATRGDESLSSERRFVTVGADFRCRIIVVVYSFENEALRIISARYATPRERRQYEEGV